MKNWIHLPLAALVAGLIGFGSSLLATPERSARADSSDASLADLAATVSELRAEQGRLTERMTALLARPAAPAAARTQVIDLDEAIASYMAKQLTGETEGASDATPEHVADPESVAIADRILSGAVQGEELRKLWQKLREEKRIDAVVAEIEHQAELSPNNPDLQSEVGKAYLQKLFDVGMGPMAAEWGEKADHAFDRALELDDSHWDARFEKAMALSNWPSFMGKQAESMHQFEILMQRQEESAQEPEHALTYFFLGNLYDQKGEHEKALATWRRGATRFPDNERLRLKTESN